MPTYIVYERIPIPRKSDSGWAVGTVKEVADFRSFEEAKSLCETNERFVVLKSSERFIADDHYSVEEITKNPVFKGIYSAIQAKIADSQNPYQTATDLLRLEADLKPVIACGNRAFKEYLQGLLSRLKMTETPPEMERLVDKFGCGMVGNLLSAYALSKKRGRPEGFSPINGDGGAMVKGAKKWSMPQEDWEWLNSQPNQSEVLRKAIALYRQ